GQCAGEMTGDDQYKHGREKADAIKPYQVEPVKKASQGAGCRGSDSRPLVPLQKLVSVRASEGEQPAAESSGYCQRNCQCEDEARAGVCVLEARIAGEPFEDSEQDDQSDG